MALHTQGGADNWRFQSGAHKRRCTQQPVVERTERWQGNVWRFTHKAVHTQGGVHNRRFVATAGVLLCKRGCRGRLPRRAKRAVCQAEPAEAMEGLAVHTHGRLWPPLESGYFGGDAGAGPQVEESESFVKRSGPRQGKVWRFTHKAVHTQGGAHNRWSIVIVLLFQRDGGSWPSSRAKRAEAREGVAVHTQGGAHTRRYVAIASVLLFQQGCVGWPVHGAQRAICRAKQAEAREGLAVHTAHNMRFVANAGVLPIKRGCGAWPWCPAKRAEANEGWAFHAQGGAHTRQRTQEAGCSHRTSLFV